MQVPKPLLIAAGLWLSTQSAQGRGTVQIVTTTEDLAAIAREVGGDLVTVNALARGYQDPHFVDPKPSFILALQRADLLVVVGRELEIGWLPSLIQQSRNAKIQVAAEGYVDASVGAHVLEIPQGPVTRAMGDVHPLGNPHYWLDPDNGRVIAREIFERLARLSPANKAVYEQHLNDFFTRLTSAEQRWDAAMAPYYGAKVVTYHRSYSNFADHFGLQVVGYVEPRPGIPPTPQHTRDLIATMNAQNVRLVLVEPYYDLKTPEAIGRATGAAVLVVPPSVGGAPGVGDYFSLFDHDIGLITKALGSTGATPR